MTDFSEYLVDSPREDLVSEDLVSVEAARDEYGVILRAGGGETPYEVDREATRKTRKHGPKEK